MKQYSMQPIKGALRNETIQYATRNKEENKDQENKLIKDINNIQQNISNGNNTQENNNLLKDKKNKLEEINEKKSLWIYSKSKGRIYRRGREKH